jgi:hypothetical protein
MRNTTGSELKTDGKEDLCDCVIVRKTGKRVGLFNKRDVSSGFQFPNGTFSFGAQNNYTPGG